MKRLVASLVGLVALGGLTLPAQAGPPDERSSDVIVVLDRGVDPRAVAAEHGGQVSKVYEHALNGFAASVPEGRLRGLERDPRVQSVEADVVVSIAAQETPTGIQRSGAAVNASLDIDGIDDLRVDADVAVLDTGADASHPDLNVVARTNCAQGSPFTQSCADGSAADGHGHGTHVAGTVGALDNGLGVVGVAPGARIHAVKVLSDSGSGYLSWIIAGIDWVTARASTIEVANMSLGGASSYNPTSAYAKAIAASVKAGVTYAVAAGNSDVDASGSMPAAHPDVITVSALADFDGQPGALGSPTCRTDQDDTLADFSNFGSVVELTAPGVCILSTTPGGGYATYSGTSMASPHVAGAAALLASGSSTMTPAQIRSKLVADGKSDWYDDSGDGVLEPRLDVSGTAAAMVAPGGTGGDGGGGGGGTPTCKPRGKKQTC